MYGYGCKGIQLVSRYSFNTNEVRCDKRNDKSLRSKEREEDNKTIQRARVKEKERKRERRKRKRVEGYDEEKAKKKKKIDVVCTAFCSDQMYTRYVNVRIEQKRTR